MHSRVLLPLVAAATLVTCDSPAGQGAIDRQFSAPV